MTGVTRTPDKGYRQMALQATNTQMRERQPSFWGGYNGEGSYHTSSHDERLGGGSAIPIEATASWSAVKVLALPEPACGVKGKGNYVQ